MRGSSRPWSLRTKIVKWNENASIKHDLLEKDEDHESIAGDGDDPEEEEEDAEDMLDKGVDRRELGPVLVGHGQHLLRGIVGVLCGCN